MVDIIWRMFGGKKTAMSSLSSGEIGQEVFRRNLSRTEGAAGKKRCGCISFQRKFLIVDEFCITI